MRKIRRTPKPGRAAVIAPNGTLFAGGVAERIKEELLKEFNLHTIVRLPNGVFAPYTSIPTNLLFFDRSGLTEEIWYYEQSLPKGGRTTPKQHRFSSRSLRAARRGGPSGRRMKGPGRCRCGRF